MNLALARALAAAFAIGAIAWLFAVVPTDAAERRDQAGQGCPVLFTPSTTELPGSCLFVGRDDPPCGEDVNALFGSDATAMVVLLQASPGRSALFLPAEVTSARAGKLTGWRPDLDLRTAPSAGRVRLDDGGGWLHLVPEIPLQVDGCRVEAYAGRFVGMISGVRNTAIYGGVF